MKKYRIPQTDIAVSCIAYGSAMLASWNDEPIGSVDKARAERLIQTAYDHGINFFDLADLYAFGKSESLFGHVLRASPGLRDEIILQSKCGQVFPRGWQPGKPIHVDLTREHIVSSAEGSLKRLGTDYLDILLLHAPSELVKPEDVAAAFDQLHRSGKVRYFGVSNHAATQIQLLKKAVEQPIIANQIHLGLGCPDAFTDGNEFTLELVRGGSANHRNMATSALGTIGYCRLQDIQIQAWSPVAGDLLSPKPDSPPHIKATAQRLAELARSKGTTTGGVALAWLLHHPAGIVPITGSTNLEHLIMNCEADRIILSNDEWYDLLAAATFCSRATSNA